MDAIIRRRVMSGGKGSIPYAYMPLTIESTSDNNVISWVVMGTMTKKIFYSTNIGTWTEATSSSEGTPLANLNTGDKIMFFAFNDYYSDADSLNCFQSTGTYIVYGNIMSLIHGGDFSEDSAFVTGSTYVFTGLFYENQYLESAEHLILPATELVEGCYDGMFYNCTSLTAAPELPATTLAQGCYSNMFNGCTSLTSAPALPATTLAEECYAYMFNGCSSLNYIKCLATDISAYYATNSWVVEVAASGTFVKAASMNSWTTGGSGIPSGWTIENA